MKLRLTGNVDELEATIKKLKQTFEVISVSKPYQNRNDKQYRVYIEIK